MMTATDLEKISHLDFDTEEKEKHQQPCFGYAVQNTKTNAYIGLNRNCPNVPVLIATRACCGLRVHLCLSCYNFLCEVVNYTKFRHTPCGTRIKRRVFLPDVEFL